MTDEANIAEAELAKAMTPLEQANALLKANERKLCAPGDDQESHFFLRFNDPDQRELYFSEEAEARAAWNSYCGPSGHWNGYLFGVVSREPTTSLASALLEKQKALEAAEARLSRLSALLDEAEAALDVFSQIAEHDIGETEADCDIFRPLTKDSVPPITVGDLRLAASVAAKIAALKDPADV